MPETRPKWDRSAPVDVSQCSEYPLRLAMAKREERTPSGADRVSSKASVRDALDMAAPPLRP